MSRTRPAMIALCLMATVLAACGKPRPPEKERPPEPQAAQPHSELREAIQAPIDKARQVDAEVQQAAEAQRAAIDAATGG